MMPNNTRERTYRCVFITAAVIMVALIIGATLLFIDASDRSVEQAVNTLSSFYMEEIVGKREVVLRDSLNRDFKLLERVVSLLETKEVQTQGELRKLLSDAQVLYGAKKLAMVDEDNLIYTAHSTFSDASRFTFLQKDFTKPQIVTSNLYGAKKQVVVAIPINDIYLQERKIVACFMQIDIDDVASSLTYENENGSSKTFIGLYYKNGDNLTTSWFDDIEPGQNLLAFIQASRLSDTQSVEKIKNGFRDGKNGLATLKLAGDTKFIYYSPVEDTDWMLTVMVHDNTIAGQLEYTSRAILRRNVLQLILTAVLLVIIFLTIGFLYKRNSDMHRRQQELEIRANFDREQKTRLEEIADMARAANMAKTNFLNSMSHDIRTPMNAIIGYTAMAKRHSDNPQVVDYLGKIDISGHQLLALVNQVLEMSRIESGKIVLEEESVDIVERAEAMNTVIAAECSERNIRFGMDTSRIVHREVVTDVSRMTQIVSNILGNAVKYTPEGGDIELIVEERPCAKEGYGLYVVTVKDTGIGMSEEFQKHIFDEFSRENTTTVSHIQGSGLGMSIVKRLVDLLEGSIVVKSKSGEGTTVSVSVPMKQDDTACQQENNTQEVQKIDYHGKRLLLVEDNEMNREIALDILEETGFTVEVAEDGEIAVDMVRKALEAGNPAYYDIILMDIQMPRMNGYDATKAIRTLMSKTNVHVPIIALSANAFEEDRTQSLLAGMDEHVAKPIDVKHLTATLAKFLQ